MLTEQQKKEVAFIKKFCFFMDMSPRYAKILKNDVEIFHTVPLEFTSYLYHRVLATKAINPIPFPDDPKFMKNHSPETYYQDIPW